MYSIIKPWFVALILHFILMLRMGGQMSKDNLILFPKKSKPSIEMTEAEAKWVLSGSLAVILTIAIGVNSTLFSQKQQAIALNDSSPKQDRNVASINPIFKVSWEKRAFEVLDKSQERDLANVGQSPSTLDNFTFGDLNGQYQIRKNDGIISAIELSQDENSKAKTLLQREGFLFKNLALFSTKAKNIHKIHTEDNDERLIEKYQMTDQKGQDIGLVQLLLDKNQKLISMTVQ
jgi:hypothetical protein